MRDLRYWRAWACAHVMCGMRVHVSVDPASRGQAEPLSCGPRGRGLADYRCCPPTTTTAGRDLRAAGGGSPGGANPEVGPEPFRSCLCFWIFLNQSSAPEARWPWSQCSKDVRSQEMGKGAPGLGKPPPCCSAPCFHPSCGQWTGELSLPCLPSSAGACVALGFHVLIGGRGTQAVHGPQRA